MQQEQNNVYFPHYGLGMTDQFFIKHLRAPLVPVLIRGKSPAQSGYVAVETTFNIFKLCVAPTEIRKLKIESVAYVDKDDTILFHEVTPHDPVEISEEGTFRFGMVSKIDGLRWGVNFEIDGITGKSVIKIDRESPIIGVKFSLRP